MASATRTSDPGMPQTSCYKWPLLDHLTTDDHQIRRTQSRGCPQSKSDTARLSRQDQKPQTTVKDMHKQAKKTAQRHQETLIKPQPYDTSERSQTPIQRLNDTYARTQFATRNNGNRFSHHPWGVHCLRQRCVATATHLTSLKSLGRVRDYRTRLLKKIWVQILRTR